jgi:hypothetical protein
LHGSDYTKAALRAVQDALHLLPYDFRRFGGPLRTAIFAGPVTQGGSAAPKLLYERLRRSNFPQPGHSLPACFDTCHLQCTSADVGLRSSNPQNYSRRYSEALSIRSG